MERYTAKNARACFAMLAKACGKSIARSYKDIGAWTLDESSYGGYIIEEVCNISGGVFHPMGELRYNAREFCAMCHFAIRAIENAQK